MFKIDNKLTRTDVPIPFTRKALVDRTHNSKPYVHMISHSNPLFSSFYVKSVRQWNSLPNDIVLSTSLESFHAKLTSHVV